MEERKDQNGQADENVDVEQREEYSFLQETIKDEAGSSQKIKKNIFRMIGFGLIFGIAASFSFCALKPWFESRFPSNPEKVTIPKEEDDEGDAEDSQAAEDTQAVLDIDNYRQLNRALSFVANEVNKSVVEITGVTGSQDWTVETYDRKNSVAGVIIADNGQELLIFGRTSILKDAGSVTVTFCDGKTYNASLKKQDATLGFGVYAVTRTDISDTTWTQIQAAVLGSSNAVVRGDTVIALGKPFGYAEAVGYGVLSSSKNVLDAADGAYKLLCTDIAGTEEGTGVIADLKGEIVGIIDQTISDNDSMNLVTAYGISDLKGIIELLSNGEAVPYIGILGIDVTEEIESQGVPKGVYVKEVEVDSPAMAAGIQTGDIITRIGNVDIGSVSGYSTALLGRDAGSKVKIKGMRQGAGNEYVDIDFNVIIGSKE